MNVLLCIVILLQVFINVSDIYAHSFECLFIQRFIFRDMKCTNTFRLLNGFPAKSCVLFCSFSLPTFGSKSKTNVYWFQLAFRRKKGTPSNTANTYFCFRLLFVWVLRRHLCGSWRRYHRCLFPRPFLVLEASSFLQLAFQSTLVCRYCAENTPLAKETTINDQPEWSCFAISAQVQKNNCDITSERRLETDGRRSQMRLTSHMAW